MAMLAVDLDPDFTETERAAQETAHRFARDVMRPAGQALDKLTASEVIARDSVLWDVFRQHRELGLGGVDDEASGLSPAEQARIRYIVGEELGWGDTGLAISLGVAGFPAMMARMSGNPGLMERFPAGTLGCWAITEPGHGSDLINFDGTLSHPGGHDERPNCVARRDGNQFVISGQKSAWVSNGTIAEAAALFCSVDMGDGRVGGGVFVVPLNEGGVTRGKPTDKIGQRALNQGEIFFNDLKVPADSLVVPGQRRHGDDVRRLRARRLRTGDRVREVTRPGRRGDLQSSEREVATVQDVSEGRGGASPEPTGRAHQCGARDASPGIGDSVQGDVDPGGFRCRERRVAGVRRRRNFAGLSDRKDFSRCAHLDDRRRLQ